MMKSFAKRLLKGLHLEHYARHMWQSHKAYRASIADEKKRIQDSLEIEALCESDNNAKLHIGAGFNILTGWINTDAHPIHPDCRVMDAARQLPIGDQRLDYIFCEHLIEHLSHAQGVQLLAESYRCLRPKGILRIATPKLDHYLALFQEDAQANEFLARYESLLADPPMTATKALNHAVRDWGHQFLWSDGELRAALHAAGFKDIRSQMIGQSEYAALRGLERHQETVDHEVNRLETMVLEAAKP